MTTGIRYINPETATDKGALARFHGRPVRRLFAERAGTADEAGVRVYESDDEHCIIVRFETPVVTWACARSAAWFAEFNGIPRI